MGRTGVGFNANIKSRDLAAFGPEPHAGGLELCTMLRIGQVRMRLFVIVREPVARVVGLMEPNFVSKRYNWLRVWRAGCRDCSLRAIAKSTSVHNFYDSTSRSEKYQICFFCRNCDARRCDDGLRFVATLRVGHRLGRRPSRVRSW